MRLRDQVEATLRAWDAYERARGTAPVIDYDCHPVEEAPEPAGSRLEVLLALQRLHEQSRDRNEEAVRVRLQSDIAYLRALLGERAPLAEYVQQTQGCHCLGWSPEYIAHRGAEARASVERLGVEWDAHTPNRLAEREGQLTTDQAPAAIRREAAELEPTVRTLVDTDAPFALTVEAADIDAYWSYWLDGIGKDARLRLNLRRAQFTEVQARVFALHEVLGHALKGASYSARCATEDVPWVRLLSVHAPQQVLMEGLAQALPLFVIPDDEEVTARVRIAHFTQLVRAELHLAINNGTSIEDCVRVAQARVPFWSQEDIGDTLSDRAVSPQLRTYLWSYPAGIDWFVSLAEQAEPNATEVLRAAYRRPLTPSDLTTLWPDGPQIGGPGPQG
ncbi:hypothetical protein RB614_37490 [Phytohabitans sp. ZYX-F-186]|uniref:DUF885 domain-containing protein n=1 Tax=Phytohabitans maris TaxID=3071409 RepID=A0ABU0ZVJ3_9ACTN|nr:hypothetical protein [Phytohabitans sp. ZYX-F-186]MDQ7910205.1 hypothetical protein [Phytohabitans sp. ZYX-F-186]